MIVYLDTSVVLRRLLEQRRQLQEWGKWTASYASELLGLEARRVIDRLRLDSLLDDNGVASAHQQLAQMEKSIGYIWLTRPVLQRASLPMPTSVRTLDAIHLASALLFRERRREDIVFGTHDDRQATAARALGFEVIGTS